MDCGSRLPRRPRTERSTSGLVNVTLFGERYERVGYGLPMLGNPHPAQCLLCEKVAAAASPPPELVHDDLLPPPAAPRMRRSTSGVGSADGCRFGCRENTDAS